MTFSEPIQTAFIDNSDFNLVGLYRGITFSPVSFNFDASGTTLTIQYANLPDDRYTLTLFSNLNSFQDQVGLLLDGETVSGYVPLADRPGTSGNGVEGGDFTVTFATDSATQALPVPLAPVDPLGSLIYQSPSSATGTIAFGGDTDDFTIALDANQTVTILVGASDGLQPTCRFTTPRTCRRWDRHRPRAGSEAVFQAALIHGAGTYRISIGSASGLGLYSVRLIVNAAVEEEAHGGLPNDTIAEAQPLGRSFLDLGGGVSRGAVLGSVGQSLVGSNQTPSSCRLIPSQRGHGHRQRREQWPWLYRPGS